MSRRLSAATPPESRINVAAYRGDAGTWLDTSSKFRIVYAGIPSGCSSFEADTGGIANAQPLLTAAKPPASDPSIYVFWGISGR